MNYQQQQLLNSLSERVRELEARLTEIEAQVKGKQDGD
jgi:hypothetical protein